MGVTTHCSWGKLSAVCVTAGRGQLEASCLVFPRLCPMCLFLLLILVGIVHGNKLWLWISWLFWVLRVSLANYWNWGCFGRTLELHPHRNLFRWILFFFKNYLFIYFWLCWVFVSVRGLSLVAASGCHSSSRRVGLSLSRPLLLRSTGSRHAGSVVVAHGPSCSTACGIFPDQGSNPCPLHWQADSQPSAPPGKPPGGYYYFHFYGWGPWSSKKLRHDETSMQIKTSMIPVVPILNFLS